MIPRKLLFTLAVLTFILLVGCSDAYDELYDYQYSNSDTTYFRFAIS